MDGKLWGTLFFLSVVGAASLAYTFWPWGRNADRTVGMGDKRGFDKVIPLDWRLNPEGDLSILLKNIDNDTVTLVGSGSEASIAVGGQTAADCAKRSGASADLVIPPQKTSVWDIFYCPVDPKAREGDYYRVRLAMNYKAQDGQTHTSIGQMWGPIIVDDK